MDWHFKQHYTLDEARALLPQVRQWLDRLQDVRRNLDKTERVLAQLRGQGGDLGGPTVERQLRALLDFRAEVQEFKSRDIQIKDLDRGLVDFPAFIGGKEVFLCWEQGEEDIEFWHDLEGGYAGRERL